MKRIIVYLLLLLPIVAAAQKIVYSEPLKESSRDMNFEIIGKINGNLLVFKNKSSDYEVVSYQNNMELKEKVALDFLPDKTFNVDFVVYPNFFYLIYQYQKKGILYCMVAKLDGNAAKMGEPILLDTTHVGTFGENKIYNIINSEDKQKLLLHKILKERDHYDFVTLLFDAQWQLLYKTRQSLAFDDRKEILSDFLVDNQGNLVFTKAVKTNRDDIGEVNLITKAALSDTFSEQPMPLQKLFVDEVKLKVDNVNQRYLINSLYYQDRKGNISGLYSGVWDAKGDSLYSTTFASFEDSLRSLAKDRGNGKSAFNDYFIRHIILKKDGGFLLVAEDFSSEHSGSNNWNRWDYLYNSPFNYNYYSPYYSPYYGGYGNYYNGFNSFNRNNSTRYYYRNIIVMSCSNVGEILWNKLINKEQAADNTDNFLSYGTFNAGSDIHILFNNSEKRNPLLIDQQIDADGVLVRNPSLKSQDKGYDFMIRFAKQTGARQLIVPCSYRDQISFAKIDF